MDLKFKHEAEVRTAEGSRIGHIDRVVLNPKTKQVSHIVIRHGLLFPDDWVAPIRLIAQATEDLIQLREDVGDVRDLPKFEEKQYVRLAAEDGSDLPAGDGYVGSLYWYPPTGAASGHETGPHYGQRLQRTVPEETVAVREGAKVMAEDGKEVGRVEQIVTDSGSRQATHILIAKGLLAKERKLIPTFWVREFEEDEIYLAAPASVLDKLQPYEN